ncbi:MAG: DMT family transporter [Chloroflexi bacterium]|nr:DMT family transporter [Chloroflexota bacterium]
MPEAAAGFTSTDLTLLCVVSIWGINVVVVKAALVTFSPLAFNGLRFLLAPTLLVVFYALRGGSFLVTRRDALALIGLGLLGTTAYQLFFIHGLARTTAGNTALIQAALPVIVAAESHFLGHERLRPIAWAGVALSFVGLYLVIRGGAHSITFGGESFVGDLLIVCRLSSS